MAAVDQHAAPPQQQWPAPCASLRDRDRDRSGAGPALSARCVPASSVAAPSSAWTARGQPPARRPPRSAAPRPSPLPGPAAPNDRGLGARGSQDEPAKWKDSRHTAQLPSGRPPARPWFCPSLLNPLVPPRVDEPFTRGSRAASVGLLGMSTGTDAHGARGSPRPPSGGDSPSPRRGEVRRGSGRPWVWARRPLSAPSASPPQARTGCQAGAGWRGRARMRTGRVPRQRGRPEASGVCGRGLALQLPQLPQSPQSLQARACVRAALTELRLLDGRTGGPTDGHHAALPPASPDRPAARQRHRQRRRQRGRA